MTVWTFQCILSSVEISIFTSVKDCCDETLGTISAAEQSDTQRHGCGMETFWTTAAFHKDVIRNSTGSDVYKQNGVVISSDQYEQHHPKTNTCLDHSKEPVAKLWLWLTS